MTQERERYNPRNHFIKLPSRQKGGGPPVDYLPVAERVRWFRDEHPEGSIDTSVIELSDARAVMLVRVSIPNGGSASTIGSEHKAAFPDYIEKAATVALGRALAILGFGVGFTDEFDERREEADKREYEIDNAAPMRETDTGRRFPTPQTNGGFVQAPIQVDGWLKDFAEGVGMTDPTGWTPSKSEEAFNKAGSTLVQRWSAQPNQVRDLFRRLHAAFSGQPIDREHVGKAIDSRLVRAVNKADAETLEMLRQLTMGG